jgi:hypothetical protein
MSSTVYPSLPDTLGKGPAANGGSAAADKRECALRWRWGEGRQIALSGSPAGTRSCSSREQTPPYCRHSMTIR